MPRKHQPTYTSYRPQPSYNTSNPSSTSSRPAKERTVNSLLQNLRAQSPLQKSSLVGPLPTVPPSVQSILGVTPPPPPPPRPRALPPPLRRRVPGPPPPASWLIRDHSNPSSAAGSEPGDNDYLGQDEEGKKDSGDNVWPGRTQVPREMISPEEDSLQHHTMKIIAENWMLYQEYLHFLPVRHKSLLLSYLAADTLDRARKAAIEESETAESKTKQKTNQTPIASPLTPKLLHSLFPTDADDVHFLDLSYIRDLSAFSSVLAGKLVTRPPSQHGTIQTPSDTIPDNWDSSPSPIPETSSSFTSIEAPTSHPFAYVTHLSISIPASTRVLTTILSHLPRITHLYIHPPLQLASASTAPVHLDIPRALPRKTLALEHLELPRSYVAELLRVEDWAGAWLGVRRIVLRGAGVEERRRVREWVVGLRRGVGVGGWEGWCEVLGA